MKMTRRILSWVLAVAMVVTCAISGMVLPVTAGESTNLLTNGDFEQGASVSWGNSEYVVSGAGKGDGVGIKIETSVSAEDNTSKKITVYYKGVFLDGILEPNTTYSFSFDYKHEGKGYAQLYVPTKYVGSDWTGWANTVLTTEVGWTTQTIEFTTGSAENWPTAKTGWEWGLQMIHNMTKPNVDNYGTGTVWFDNFSLVKKGEDVEDDVVELTGITLNESDITLEVGDELTLAVTATPDGAEVPTVAWTTSDANVATVENGKVTAVAVGTATITATAEGLAPVTCAVTVTEPEPVAGSNLLTNGDFEQGASVSWGNNEYVVSGAGKGDGVGIKIETSVSAEDNTSKKITVYYKGVFLDGILEPNTTYSFSFDYKHEGKGYAQLYVPTKYVGSDWTGWANTVLTTEVGWTTQTIEFTTGSAENWPTAKTGWEWGLQMIHNMTKPNVDNYGTGTVWFDNFSLVKIGGQEATVSVADVENGTLSVDKTDATAGDTVTVTVTPNADCVMVPGTLTYTVGSGESVKILNETWGTTPVWGRESAGNTFEFEMPDTDKKVTVTATFEQASYSMDTVGTSTRQYEKGADNIQWYGIRFLTRLNLADEFNASADGLTLGGYEVLKIGSKLTRDTSIWDAVAYEKGQQDTMKLVDYTDSYIDFASIMKTRDVDRTYTARGYIVLDLNRDSVIDENEYIYSEHTQTDSYREAATRAGIKV